MNISDFGIGSWIVIKYNCYVNDGEEEWFVFVWGRFGGLLVFFFGVDYWFYYNYFCIVFFFFCEVIFLVMFVVIKG